jgi:hypothetical protein
MSKKVAFSTEHLSLRGTETALFDYAKYNKVILGNESIVVINGNQPEHKNPARKKFEDEFGVIYKQHSIDEFNKILETNKVDVHYKISAGHIEPIPSACKNVIHAVFPGFTPFGNVYAYVSEWLRDFSVPKNLIQNYDFVPHIVQLPDINENLKKELNIPNDGTVFGYHGGSDSFDLHFVKTAINRVIFRNKNIYFIFMNIEQFINHPHVIFLPGTHDLIFKTKFINTCDAMIHARSRGETFGLSIAEFSIRNKPIITYNGSTERNHINILKNSAILYNNENDVYNIFANFKKEDKIYDMYSSTYNPTEVMKKFNIVFIEGN